LLEILQENLNVKITVLQVVTLSSAADFTDVTDETTAPIITSSALMMEKLRF
jgi:hypothetical protein